MQNDGGPTRPDVSPPSPPGNTAVAAVLVVVTVSVMILLYAVFGPGLFFLILLGLAIIGAGWLHFWLWGRSMDVSDHDESE